MNFINEIPKGGCINYSTEEQIVGEWIDKKPLYQRTFVDTIPAVDEKKNIPIGTNIDHGFVVSAYSQANGTTQNVMNGYTNNFSSDNPGHCKVYINETTQADGSPANTICVIHDIANWVGFEIEITIRYTKAED